MISVTTTQNILKEMAVAKNSFLIYIKGLWEIPFSEILFQLKGETEQVICRHLLEDDNNTNNVILLFSSEEECYSFWNLITDSPSFDTCCNAFVINNKGEVETESS